MSTIKDGDIVAFHYVLKGSDGEVLDDSHTRKPMLHMQGARNIVRGLERAMSHRRIGDTFSVTLPPEEAYGVRQGDAMPIPRSAFPPEANLEPGGQFMTRTQDGRPMMLWITQLDDEQVWVDPHHPLVDKTLTWEVEIVGIRTATEEEKEMGHPQFDADDA